MLDAHGCCPLKGLQEPPGRNGAQMAHAWSLDARPVASWLRHERFRPRQGRPRARTLAPCKPQRVQMRDTYPSSAAQVFQRVRAQGCEGGDSLVTASGRPVRPRRQAAVLPLALAPGEGAQGDWGSCGAVPVGHTCRRRRFFGMGRCESRRRSGEGTGSQTLEPFVACHQHAGEVFGGMPHPVMVDNRTSTGLQHALGAAPVGHPPSRAFAPSHGLPLAPCHGGKGHKKGRVEHGVGYVKTPCVAGLELADLRVLHPAARHGRDTVATSRLPGATRPQPTDRWPQERPPRSPLPAHPFDLATVSPRRAARPCRVPLATQRASVPAPWAGHALPRPTSPDRLCLSHGETRIARQSRRDDRWQDFADPDHPKPRLEQRNKARDPQGCRRGLALSSPAETSDRPRAARRRTPHHHGRNIVALRAIYPPPAVGRALEDALVSEAFSADSSANRVAPRARFTPAARPLHRTRRHDRLAVRLEPPALSR
jgi:transposase